MASTTSPRPPSSSAPPASTPCCTWPCTQKVLLKYHLPIGLAIGLCFGYAFPPAGIGYSGLMPKSPWIKMSNINVLVIFLLSGLKLKTADVRPHGRAWVFDGVYPSPSWLPIRGVCRSSSCRELGPTVPGLPCLVLEPYSPCSFARLPRPLPLRPNAELCALVHPLHSRLPLSLFATLPPRSPSPTSPRSHPRLPRTLPYLSRPHRNHPNSNWRHSLAPLPSHSPPPTPRPAPLPTRS